MRIQPLHSAARRIIQPSTTSQSLVHFSSMADTALPKFAAGEDEVRLKEETAALLQSKWTLDETQQGLKKTFNFPTYAKALDLILLIGVETKLQNHHPELRNSYKSVFYHWTTHSPRGLTTKDVHMARLCDEKAKLLGYLAVSDNEQKTPASVT